MMVSMYVLCMNISRIENLCLRNSSCVYEACVVLSSDKKCRGEEGANWEETDGQPTSKMQVLTICR